MNVDQDILSNTVEDPWPGRHTWRSRRNRDIIDNETSDHLHRKRPRPDLSRSQKRKKRSHAQGMILVVKETGREWDSKGGRGTLTML